MQSPKILTHKYYLNDCKLKNFRNNFIKIKRKFAKYILIKYVKFFQFLKMFLIS